MRKIKSREFMYAVAGIAIVVFLGNLVSIFGTNILIQDDQAIYSEALAFNLPFWTGNPRGIFGPFSSTIPFLLPFFELLPVDIHLARMAFILVYIIPLSAVFFALLWKYLDISLFVAFGAAVLPNILPREHSIPAFIFGSYPAVGLFFFFLAVIAAFEFTAESGKKYFAILSLFFFYLCILSMEHSVFLFPIMVLLVVLRDRISKKSLILIGSFSALIGAKAVWTMLHPRATHSYTLIPLHDMLQRSVYGISTMIPTPFRINSESGLLVFILVLFVMTAISCVIAYRRKPSSGHVGGQSGKNVLLLFLVFGMWVICASFVFVVMAPFLSSRYFHVAAFGMSLIITGNIYFLTHRIRYKKLGLHHVLIAVVIIGAVVARNENISAIVAPMNQTHSFLEEKLKPLKFEKNAQIVIAGDMTVQSAGFYLWSTGYLKYVLGRADVSGVLPLKYNYYDPFNVKRRSYAFRMSGLDISKPTYVFEANVKTRSFIQCEYGLRWKSEDVKDPDLRLIKKDQLEAYRKNMKSADEVPWDVLKFDKTNGSVSVLKTGKGYKEYLKYLDSVKANGIIQDRIMWGAGSLL